MDYVIEGLNLFLFVFPNYSGAVSYKVIWTKREGNSSVSSYINAEVHRTCKASIQEGRPHSMVARAHVLEPG